MKVQEAPTFPPGMDAGLRYELGRWMRSAAQEINRDTDDIVIDLATKGLVLKDTQSPAHYWRVTVTTLGALTTTDLGTGKP